MNLPPELAGDQILADHAETIHRPNTITRVFFFSRMSTELKLAWQLFDKNGTGKITIQECGIVQSCANFSLHQPVRCPVNFTCQQTCVLTSAVAPCNLRASFLALNTSVLYCWVQAMLCVRLD
jgi:hypothetical protein